MVKNYSRFGMYFESDIPLSPGTTIVIRYLGCDSDNRIGSSLEREAAPYYCKDIKLVSEACQEIKTLVVAEVKRCENCKHFNGEPYGIGVNYISPAV